jgi:hypothetical protein
MCVCVCVCVYSERTILQLTLCNVHAKYFNKLDLPWEVRTQAVVFINLFIAYLTTLFPFPRLYIVEIRVISE